MSARSNCHKFYFNPRSREGSDPTLDSKNLCNHPFQSTLPRGERRKIERRWHGRKRFQSTLPRGERRDLSEIIPPKEIISIHAPARGATTKWAHHLFSDAFQSTLPRGERRTSSLDNPLSISDFNPRSREGSDRLFPSCIVMLKSISIHAPARGATHSQHISVVAYSVFQSTLPRGERRQRKSIYKRSSNFNPRSREGSDRS